MRTTTLLLALATLPACSSKPPPPFVAQPTPVMAAQAEPHPAAASGPLAPSEPTPSAEVAGNLARLRALDVFKVGQMMVESDCPEPSATCVPSAKARARAEARLAAFTAAAEQAGSHPAPAALAEQKLRDNLAALSALKIVEVGDLIYDNPSEAHNCYGPCAPRTAADKRRVQVLASLIARSEGL